MKRKRKPRWVLLFRIENGYSVHVYEPLQKHELKSRLRAGWTMLK